MHVLLHDMVRMTIIRKKPVQTNKTETGELHEIKLLAKRKEKGKKN